MSAFKEMRAPDRYALSTRLFHAGLALTICVQLATSLAMDGPSEHSAGGFLFQIHRYSGLAALGFALLFWLTIAIRRRGTDIAALVPWFSAHRRRQFFLDLAQHLRALLRLRLPEFDETGPLASAVHGLGLLLVTTMAVTGTVYAIEVWAGLHSAEPDGILVMEVHQALANLVWAYLIGHAGMATLHHFARTSSMARMWSFRD